MRHSSLVFLLAPVVLLSACSGLGWKQHPVSVGAVPVLSTERPVRVTRLDGTVIIVADPRVVGDSLIGNVGNPPERAALLLRDVRRLEERSVTGTASRSLARTALQVAGAVVLGWLIQTR